MMDEALPGATALTADTRADLEGICGDAIAGFENRVFLPEAPHGLYAAGALYYSAGLFDRAARALERSLAALPTAKGFYLLGLCRKETRDATGALEAFHAALELQPDLLLAYYPAAAVYRSRGDFESAQRLLEGALEHFRGTTYTSFIENELGLTLEQKGDFAAAEQRFREASEARDVDTVPARVNQALMLYKLGRGERAREILEKILVESSRRRTPHASPEISFRICYVLGSLALDAGNPREARDLLARSLSFQPSAPACNTLAIACEAAGDRDGALAALHRALEIQPSYATARRNLAKLAAAPSKEH